MEATIKSSFAPSGNKELLAALVITREVLHPVFPPLRYFPKLSFRYETLMVCCPFDSEAHSVVKQHFCFITLIHVLQLF